MSVWSRIQDGLSGLGTRDRRALLVGLLILGPALLWVAVVRPWWSHVEEVRESLAAEQSLLERERALLRAGPRLPERIRAADLALRRKRARLARYPNLALAEAAVTRRVEESAAASRALLLDVRSVAPPQDEDPPPGLVPIRLGIRAESDFEGMLTLLSALEEDSLLLRIVGWSMQPAEDEGVMTLEAIVEAYAPAERGAGPEDDSSEEAA